MKFNLSKGLAGIALAVAMIGGPLAGSAMAQTEATTAVTTAATTADTTATTATTAAAPAAATPAPPPKIDSGDTAWMMASGVLAACVVSAALAGSGVHGVSSRAEEIKLWHKL